MKENPEQTSIFDAPPQGPFVRRDDHAAAQVGADHVLETEGEITKLRPGTHRHKTLRAYAESWPEELTATEAGQRATPWHDRVTGGTRRTYDLSALRLIERGVRGFLITVRGREVLRQLDLGVSVEVEALPSPPAMTEEDAVQYLRSRGYSVRRPEGEPQD